jgi:SAM-dependent methyltransferase
MNTQSPIVNTEIIFPPVACPRCQAQQNFSRDQNQTEGVCPLCQLSWQYNHHILQWLSPSTASVPRTNDLKRYWSGINSYFHPISGRYSPLKQITRIRKETFYQRTLNDLALAKAWANHYLKGLTIPSDATVFDHGCGRGRTIALLNQLGYTTYGIEIAADPWWQNLEKCFFQVMSPQSDHLPWQPCVFNMVLDIEVIGHLTETQLTSLCAEIHRILKPNGYWIILEANSAGLGAFYPRKHYGRLHSLQKVHRIAEAQGFEIVDTSYEGFYSPVFPNFFNFLRKQCAPWPLDISDFNSKLAALLPPRKRALWLARLQKKA